MYSWRHKKRERRGQIRLASLEDPMAIIPTHAPGARALRNPSGKTTLDISLPCRNAIDRFTTRWFGMERNAQVNLDKVGETYWKLVNGKRSLRQIAEQLARRFDFETEDARLATLEFTKRLLTRGFVTINLPSTGGDQAWRAT